MAQVIYDGDHAAVFVPVTPYTYIEAKKGEPVEVDDDLATRLTDSASWKAVGDKPAASKKAKAEKPEPEAEEAD
jgi:hypothetical protein